MDSTLVKMILNIVEEGSLDDIKKNLEKYNLDINLLIDNENQQNAFFYCALIKNDLEALKICEYFKSIGLNPLFKDRHQQTCLYYFVREGKIKCSEFLINECKIPINEKDVYGQNPIYYAAREGHLELCKLLVDKGSDVNLEDKFGQTCIFYAIKQGQVEVIEYLITHGANVNKIDKKKQTPVSFALKNNQTKIAELLIEHGGIKPETGKEKTNKENKKNPRRKTSEEIEKEKHNMISAIQVPLKHILVKIGENGEKTALTNEEFASFKEKNKKLFEILENKELLKKYTDKFDEETKINDSWEKVAKKLMTSLWKHKEAQLFHKPVDPEELNVPDYFNIIKHPMDFSTIKKKLNNYAYTNLSEFCGDMDLTFNNCYLYNGTETSVGHSCTLVKEEYNRLFNDLGLKKFLLNTKDI